MYLCRLNTGCRATFRSFKMCKLRCMLWVDIIAFVVHCVQTLCSFVCYVTFMQGCGAGAGAGATRSHFLSGAGAGAGATLTLWVLWLRLWKLKSYRHGSFEVSIKRPMSDHFHAVEIYMPLPLPPSDRKLCQSPGGGSPGHELHGR